MNREILVAIADDSESMRALLKAYLTQRGIKVLFECSNGRQLLEYLSGVEILPDICILDANMPVLSGYATAKKLISTYPQIRIIGLSFFDERCKERMLGNGADICIDKSLDPDELAFAIEAIARHRFS